MKLVRLAWKTLVAVKDALVLIAMLVFFGGLYALMSAGGAPEAARDGALRLALNGVLVEQREQLDPMAILSGQTPASNEIALRDLLHAINSAARNSSIKAIVLDLDGFAGGGQVALNDVATALTRVRRAGKPVLAYATAYTDDGYRLAAAANEIWLDPMGAALFTGPGGSRLYYRGILERLGVNVHVYRVGKFKSFVEPYILAEQSPEARAAGQELADALWQEWLGAIKIARPKAQLTAYAAAPAARIASNGGSLARTALSAGIVDTLGDSAAFGKRVAKLVGSDSRAPAGDYNYSDLETYLAAHPEKQHGKAIGVVHVAGEIVDGEAPNGRAGGDTIARLVRDALRDQNLKALVVRIDSPGGSALAAEKIRLALEEARAQKLPVVISMGSVAASGGYWVAMAGDRVFAEPATITGSIGVFGILPTFEATLGKYGVTSDGVQTTPLSGQPDLYAGTNATTDALFQAGVEDVYRRFITLVAEHRKLPLARVDELAQGRVWPGGMARQIGLIDAFGSLDDALAEAARRANIKPGDYHPLWIENRASFWSEWLGAARPAGARRDIVSLMVAQQQALLGLAIDDAAQLMAGPAVQVRCIECPPVRRVGVAAPQTWIQRLNRVLK